ncbi:MAG: class I SAM-dependent methyltransferase [Verrucomicrobia bacterium]|nr:class I SAM-dependent methyltransferase [Verrucomicrobiota bacterium]
MTEVSEYYNTLANNYSEQYRRENLNSLGDYPANYFRLQILVRRIAGLGLKSVFEVGTGEGTPLLIMASMGLRVAGCDIAHSMVKKARDTFEEHGLAPELVQWGDIEDAATLAAQLKDGQFDAVIAAGVLPHVKNDGLMLDNIGMFVRSGGRVFVEFRNKLFSLFTFNRYTQEFILNDLLHDVSPDIKEVVAGELAKRLATDQPPIRVSDESGKPSYDSILSRFHNPFELLELFKGRGYREPVIHWYHYHPAPPMLENALGETFRNAALSLEHEGSWRGWFLCSAGVIEAVKD